MQKPNRVLGAVAVLAGAGLVVQLGASAPPHVVVTGSAAVRERATTNPVTTINADLLEKIPTGRRSDQIIATLPENRPVTAGKLPDGWQMNQNGRDVRIWGPALDRVRFRLDLNGRYIQDYAGKQATLQSSFQGTKDDPLKLSIEQWQKVETSPNLEGILTLPYKAGPGQPILIGVAPGYRDGTWRFTTNGGSVPLLPLEDLKNMEVIKGPQSSLYGFSKTDGYVQLMTKPAPRPFITEYPVMGSFTRVRYTDPWGEDTVDAPISILPATPTPGTRWLESASPLAFVGQAACVSGRFPTFEDAYGLLLDGKTELQPWSVSTTTIMVGIPDGTTAGEHTISVPGGSSSVKIGILTVDASLDQNKLWRGESTTMRLRVLGTDKQFPLAVLNRTPGVITIDGGVRQVVTTSGGADNSVTRSVTGIQRGNFSILWSVNAPGCGG